jgi:Holliday junction resolvase RusA-like endonuclease
MNAIAFFIQGEPAPKGSLVAVQRGVYLESNRQRLNPWLQAIKAKARQLEALAPIDGNLEVEIVFFLTRPATVTRLLPNVKPDLDKKIRAVFDGLKGFIQDDARIVRVTGTKLYADAGKPAGAFVRIEKLDDAGVKRLLDAANTVTKT